MADFPELLDGFTFWLVNLSSCFMLSAAHNVLFFVLDLHTVVLHFLHFICTFVFLMVRIIIAERGRVVLKLFSSVCKGNGREVVRNSLAYGMSVLLLIYPAVIGQALVTFLSTHVHSQNRSGELYLIRLFDFLATLTALKMKLLVLKELDDNRKEKIIWRLLVPVALFGSLSWLEIGHIEYSGQTLLLAPLLAVAQGFLILLIKRAYANFCTLSNKETILSQEEDGADDACFEEFGFHLFGWTSLIVFIPALMSYSGSVVSHDAAWESIDYVIFVRFNTSFFYLFYIILIGMSVVFMASFKYSELWLQTHLELHTFCALEHTKFFVASCGQWFLQNMAHATIYAACGKGLFVASSFRYWSNFGGLGSNKWWKKESDA